MPSTSLDAAVNAGSVSSRILKAKRARTIRILATSGRCLSCMRMMNSSNVTMAIDDATCPLGKLGSEARLPRGVSGRFLPTAIFTTSTVARGVSDMTAARMVCNPLR